MGFLIFFLWVLEIVDNVTVMMLKRFDFYVYFDGFMGFRVHAKFLF